MATIRRIGFGTIFELENDVVGIGTDNPTHKLQALGNIRSEAATDIGISSLTTYQGFINKEARFTKGQIDNQSQSGSTSGEIVIDGDVTVSSATTFTSGPQNLTVTDTFTLPSGDTNSRELKPTPGSLRFNQDFATLEFYTGNNWATVNTFTEMQNSPGNRGRSVHAGGANPLGGSFLPDMSHFEHATFGVGLAFGDLTVGGQGLGGFSSSTRGLFSGRRTPSTNPDNIIDYITIASTGDAIDFGDMRQKQYNHTAASSPTKGFIFSGSLGDGNEIQMSNIASTGQTMTEVGVTATDTGSMMACANSVRAVIFGGGNPVTDLIQSFGMSSLGNAVEFGNLSAIRMLGAAVADGTRAVSVSGRTPTTVNIIEFVQIATGGSAEDFGDMTDGLGRQKFMACSDSHGGVGGF